MGLKMAPSDRPSWIEITRPASSIASNAMERMKPRESPITNSIGAAMISGAEPADAPAPFTRATVNAAEMPNLTSVGTE